MPQPPPPPSEEPLWVLSQAGLSSGAATHGRFMQADPNATAMVLIRGTTFHGQAPAPAADDFNLESRHTDGANLYEYLGSNPWIQSDPLGLTWDPFEYFVDDYLAEDAGSKAAFMEELRGGFDSALHMGMQVAQLHPGVALAVSAYNIASGNFTVWDLVAAVPGSGIAGGVLSRAGGSLTHARGAYAIKSATKRLGRALQRAEDMLPAAFKGPATNHVYLGFRGGQPVYVGITNSIQRRQREHGLRFQWIQQITPRLSLLQAKAVETLIQIGNPHFKNKIAGVGSRNPIFSAAMTWAGAWMRKNGIPINY